MEKNNNIKTNSRVSIAEIGSGLKSMVTIWRLLIIKIVITAKIQQVIKFFNDVKSFFKNFINLQFQLIFFQVHNYIVVFDQTTSQNQ